MTAKYMQNAERPARIDRIAARPAAWFLRLFGVALLVDVATEITAGVWHVHAGHLYPWRHLGIIPLYPTSVLSVEWLTRGLAGLALALGAHSVKVVAPAVRIAAVVLFVALLERYSNHGALLFLIAMFVSLAPPDVASSSFAELGHPALGLVRAQLVIVYVFSALNKLTHGFASGQSLGHLLGGAISPGSAQALSWVVLATEVAIPVVLLRWPRAGIAMVVSMHLTFAALLPGVASFGLAMLAMAVLFVGSNEPPRAPDARTSGPTSGRVG